ncbi:MAG TPA: DUF6011 domain-containing protein [Candidatus Paceibacterota bacterium]
MTTTTKPRQLPWLRYADDVDRQTAAGIAREQARALNGTPAYRDPGTHERYTVGYGAERTYQAKPAARPAKDFTPSDAQIRFLDGLLVEREHTYTEAQIAEGKADWRKIRPMLDELKVSARRDPRARQTQPKVETLVEEPAPVRARLDFKSITDGNYAIRVDGVVKFYRVSTSKNGFKNVQVRASDALYMQYGKAGIAILHKIVEAGLAESQMLFATELGRCWKCGKTLTDETSRAVGMGPDCASK